MSYPNLATLWLSLNPRCSKPTSVKRVREDDDKDASVVLLDEARSLIFEIDIGCSRAISLLNASSSFSLV